MSRVSSYRPQERVAHIGDKVSLPVRNALIDLAIRVSEHRAFVDDAHALALIEDRHREQAKKAGWK